MSEQNSSVHWFLVNFVENYCKGQIIMTDSVPFGTRCNPLSIDISQPKFIYRCINTLPRFNIKKK